MLAALAQATRRVRLGTLVTGIHHRHPAVLAAAAAELEEAGAQLAIVQLPPPHRPEVLEPLAGALAQLA